MGVVNTSKGRNFAAVGILKHKKHMEVTCHLTLPLQSSCTTIVPCRKLDIKYFKVQIFP